MLSQKESFGVKTCKRSKRNCLSKYSSGSETGNTSTGLRSLVTVTTPTVSGLQDLSSDCIEQIALFLDTKSALALFRSCRKIYFKLNGCVHFWKQLCQNEAFQEFNALKKDNNDRDAEGELRKSWSGQIFHQVVIPPEATFWHRVFLRGVNMRRNVIAGNYEVWRLFMTDKESCPVMKMTADTTFRELRTRHRRCRFNDQRRRVRISRYWNEDYLVAIQHNISNSFNDIFVWQWKECQSPKFLYSFDLSTLYPTGLFPTSFFLWKHYFVLMPENGHLKQKKQLLRSMIRVHDLEDNFSLVGSYDFPESGPRRHAVQGLGGEASHLHKVQDRAVALCRMPKLTFFVFSLPYCELLHSVELPLALEQDEMDQRFLLRDNTMMFLFHDQEFFNNVFLANDDNDTFERKYGKLVVADFNKYLNKEGNIEIRLDINFDSNEDFIEKISLVDKTRMICVTGTGKVVMKELSVTGETSLAFLDTLVIPCPGRLKEQLMDDDLDLSDSDGPNLCTNVKGDLIVVLRQFEDGRKIHGYTCRGDLLYTINCDSPHLGLEPRPGYVSLDLDGNFVCCADQDRICLWSSRTGEYLNTINIPPHYNFREDPSEATDKYCWKGHTDFAFTEDGIIIIHSQRNFPIAADVLLFW